MWRTSLDEVLRLRERINTRKLSDYRMLLTIQHTDKPQELAKTLDNELKQLTPLRTAELDTAGMDRLKTMMVAQSKGFVIK